MQQAEVDNLMSMILVFCFIWSAGANLYDNARDNFLAKVLLKTCDLNSSWS